MLELQEKKQSQQVNYLRGMIQKLKTELQEKEQPQQVIHLRGIIQKLKTTFQQERDQMGIEIQGLTLENKNLKNENKELKGDQSKITEIARDPMKTMKTMHTRLLNRIDQLKTENKDLKEMMAQLFDCPPSIVPMTPEKPKALSVKKKSSVMDVNETPRKSRRLMKKGSKKKRKTRVRRTPRKSGRKLSFKK